MSSMLNRRPGLSRLLSQIVQDNRRKWQKNHGWANRVTCEAKTLPLNAKELFCCPPYLLHSSASERCTHPLSTVSNFFLAAAIADSPRHGKCCYSCCCCGGGDHFGSAIVRYSQKGCIKGQYLLPKKWVYQKGNFLLKMGAP